jgi:hypothetical protein
MVDNLELFTVVGLASPSTAALEMSTIGGESVGSAQTVASSLVVDPSPESGL